MSTIAPDWLESQIHDQQGQRYENHIHGDFMHSVAIEKQTLAELEKSAFYSRKYGMMANPRSVQWQGDLHGAALRRQEAQVHEAQAVPAQQGHRLLTSRVTRHDAQQDGAAALFKPADRYLTTDCSLL